MMKRLVLGLFAAGLVGLAACSGDDVSGNDTIGGDDTTTTGTTVGSCIRADKSLCVDFLGSYYTEATARTTCGYDKGAFVAGEPCTSEGAFGKCHIAAGGEANAFDNVYYREDYTANDCTSSGGTWTAF